MSQFLPLSKFKWVPKEYFEEINLHGIADWDLVGYLVECDLEYHADLQELHNYYRMALERVRIDVTMVTDTHVEIARHYARNRAQANGNLVLNLMAKKRYLTFGPKRTF